MIIMCDKLLAYNQLKPLKLRLGREKECWVCADQQERTATELLVHRNICPFVDTQPTMDVTARRGLPPVIVQISWVLRLLYLHWNVAFYFSQFLSEIFLHGLYQDRGHNLKYSFLRKM